jgi:Fe-S-cluster containining protein
MPVLVPLRQIPPESDENRLSAVFKKPSGMGVNQMIGIEQLLEKGGSTEVESMTRHLLERMLAEIHSPCGIDDLWPDVESQSRFQEMRRYWTGWKRPYREGQWQTWCREMEGLAYGTRAYCLLCGECCQKGSPSLYAEDLPWLRQGFIKRSDLVTLRFGEIGYSPYKNDLVLVSEERIKIKEKPGSRECLFFDPEENKCRIYEKRPLQCRTMECWNPGGFQSLEGLRFLSREDLLNPEDPLIPIIETHGKRCDLAMLHEVLGRILKGGAFAQQEILEMVFFDQHARDFLRERQGFEEGHLDFLFGRSLKEILPIFGLRLEMDEDGTFTIKPPVSDNEKSV